jgi:hypothetical protein
LVNSAYNYRGGLSAWNDVGRLMRTLPAAVVHLYFIVTCALYVGGLFVVLAYSRTARRR